MNKTKLISALMGGILLLQGSAALAVNSPTHLKGYAEAVYAAQEKNLTHAEKLALLIENEILTKDFVKDESKTVTYEEAAISLLAARDYLNAVDLMAEGSVKNKYIYALVLSLSEPEDETKYDADAVITVKDYADWALTLIGYSADMRTGVPAPADEALLGEASSADRLTVSKLVDMLYATVNTPLRVIDSWDTEIQPDGTALMKPHLIILDGHEDKNGNKYDYATLLTELQDNKETEAAAAASPAPTETSQPKKAETLEEMTNDLKSLGIVADVPDLRLDDTLTRAEAAKLLVYSTASDEIKLLPNDRDYNDVSAEHWAFDVIHIATECGYINGDNGSFRPEDIVTTAEWAKMLVCAAGYGIYADNMGGYPHGYMTQAASLEITKDISAANNDALTRGDAFRMLYNAMNVPVLSEYAEDGETVYHIMNGSNDMPYETLRTLYVSRNK